MRGSLRLAGRWLLVAAVAALVFALGCSMAYGYGWSSMGTFTSEELNGIAVAPDGELWATGVSGTYYRSDDLGTMWNPHSVATTYSLIDVVFTDETGGWLCADSAGLVYETDDGGESWDPSYVGHMTSLSRPYVLGSHVWIPAPGFAGVVKAYTPGSGWVSLNVTGSTQSFYGACFVTEEEGYAVGTTGAIHRTVDGGDTWTDIAKAGVSATMRDIAVTDAGTVIAVSSSGHILRSESQGADWETNPTNPGSSLYRVVNHEGGLWAAGWDSIVHSGDDGVTWVKYDTGDTTIWDVDFADTGEGYAVGSNGALFKYTPPVPPVAHDVDVFDATQVEATWDASADAHHYEVIIGDAEPIEVAGTSTSFAVGINESVEIAVRAVTVDGYLSQWSRSTISNTAHVPAAPTLTAAGSVSVPQVNVSWSAVAHAASYQYRLNGGAPLSTTSTSVDVTGLSAGANTIEVRAVGAFASSGWSLAPVTYTPPPAAQTITLAASPSNLAYPKTAVVVSGFTGGHAITATLEQRVGTGAWTPIGPWTSDANGNLPGLSRKVTATTQYRVSFAGNGQWAPAVSNVVTVVYKPTVKTPSVPSVKVKRSFTAKVEVQTPIKDTRGKVTLRYYKKSGSKYTYVKKVTASRGSWKSGRTLYSGKTKLTSKGTWKVTATYEGKGYYANKTSSKTFKVK